MIVDIKKLKNIKNELDCLNQEDNVLFVNENGTSKYVIMTSELYDEIEQTKEMLDNVNTPGFIINSNEDIELTYEQYETIKKNVLKMLDDALKPKPENLN
ncbi:MAG: hypothetical protein Q4E33_01675 [Erysipelotrichaceae bacterium]|nr:hypothetical protein [Erysipelotrichaceae bacterium]